MLFRDIVERYGVTQIASLRWLTRQCLRNPAGSLSVHRLHLDLKAQGLGVAKDALHAMMGHLQDAFLIIAVPLATDSERRRNSNPRKIYPVDAGTNETQEREIRALMDSAKANPRIQQRLLTLTFDQRNIRVWIAQRDIPDARTKKIGMIRGTLTFIDNSKLFMTEYLDLRYKTEKLMYSFHYQDKAGRLIFRYDNATHKPSLPFSDHKHIKGIFAASLSQWG